MHLQRHAFHLSKRASEQDSKPSNTQCKIANYFFAISPGQKVLQKRKKKTDGASDAPQKQLVWKPVASTVDKLLQPHWEGPAQAFDIQLLLCALRPRRGPGGLGVKPREASANPALEIERGTSPL